MRGKYTIRTTIHQSTLYVGNESLEEVLRVIDGAEKAQSQIEEGEVPPSNPEMPIVTEVHLAVHRATSGEPVFA